MIRRCAPLRLYLLAVRTKTVCACASLESSSFSLCVPRLIAPRCTCGCTSEWVYKQPKNVHCFGSWVRIMNTCVSIALLPIQTRNFLLLPYTKISAVLGQCYCRHHHHHSASLKTLLLNTWSCFSAQDRR